MIPRLGDGNFAALIAVVCAAVGLENDSPSRGRKHADTEKLDIVDRSV